jgi:hypothetical protein
MHVYELGTAAPVAHVDSATLKLIVHRDRKRGRVVGQRPYVGLAEYFKIQAVRP